MTWPAILLTAGVWLVLAYLVLFDAGVERRRRERDELRRVGGRVVVLEPRPRVRVLDDPSPRPRLTDYEWRAIAEGMEQT